jgi:hypothetical protein
MTLLSEKQLILLNKVYLPFKEKYSITLNEFVNKFSHKNLDKLVHKDLYFLMNKVNSGYDYWDNSDPSIFKPLKISFKNLTYIQEIETEDYIIGRQIHNGFNVSEKNKVLKIICFKKLMMLDYDNIILTEIEKILNNYTNLTFLIYQTYNGYHVYCVSDEFNYTKQETLQLMFDMKCDRFYINFTKYVGFVTRLQKKNGREEQEKYIERFVKQIGTKEINQKLFNLVKFKDSLI